MVTVEVVIGVSLILYVSYRLYQHLFPSPNIASHGKYVLISGCDTGFGHALAIELDKQGYHVLAGVYNPDNEEHVASQLSSRSTAFCLDITREEEIDAAYKMVKEKTNSLHALVNNAGIGQIGLVEWTTMKTFRQVMDVNFFGHVAMTKKFLPLLTSRRGSRVVNLCSTAGYVSTSGMSVYNASKFALEAFSDTLRREMHGWGLHVSIIEPGFMRTPLIDGIDHGYQELWSEVDEDTKARWGNEYFQNYVKVFTKDIFLNNPENPTKVVKALRHAVTNTCPRLRYRPGWQSSLALFPISMLPAWIADAVLAKIRKTTVLPAGMMEQIQ